MTPPDMPASYLRKSRRALQTAQSLIELGDTEGACNRAYYAMFDAAHAALWAAGAQEPGAFIKTHSGLIALFGQELVKTGRIDAEQGRALGRVQKVRLLADYTADPPPEDDARQAVAQAEAFVTAIAAAFFMR